MKTNNSIGIIRMNKDNLLNFLEGERLKRPIMGAVAWEKRNGDYRHVAWWFGLKEYIGEFPEDEQKLYNIMIIKERKTIIRILSYYEAFQGYLEKRLKEFGITDFCIDMHRYAFRTKINDIKTIAVTNFENNYIWTGLRWLKTCTFGIWKINSKYEAANLLPIEESLLKGNNDLNNLSKLVDFII